MPSAFPHNLGQKQPAPGLWCLADSGRLLGFRAL